MMPGWKLSQQQIEMLAGLRSEVQELLEEAPQQLTAPAGRVAALTDVAELTIDADQSRDFYHGLASGLHLWANYVRQGGGSRRDLEQITHTLARCCSLYLDTPE